jgi:transposase
MNSNLYLGIDVSKGYADFSLLDASRRQVGDTFQLPDTHAGHLALKQYLAVVCNQYPESRVLAATESTGGLENHWLEFIHGLRSTLPVEASRLNPTSVAKHRQADLKYQVTDKSSSVAIARYLINHSDGIVRYGEDNFARYRSFLGYITLLTKQKTQMTNHLRQMLYQFFPEILPFCRNSIPNKILDLLAKYPTSFNMAQARQGKNVGVVYFNKDIWLKLREECRFSMMAESDGLAEHAIRKAVKDIKELTGEIDQMYKLLYKELPKEQLDIITSMPGIGDRTACIILCIIGDVRRFESARQMVGFFGLYPVIKESGDFKKKPHLSKRGNSLMRKTLYMCAMVACHNDTYLSKIYRNCVDRGMAKKAALCKVMVKMLRFIYGMLIHNQKYNPVIDQQIRDKFKQKSTLFSEPLKNEEVEGIAKIIACAPISRRHANIRKEQLRAVTMTHGQTTSLAAPSSFFQKHNTQG